MYLRCFILLLWSDKRWGSIDSDSWKWNVFFYLFPYKILYQKRQSYILYFLSIILVLSLSNKVRALVAEGSTYSQLRIIILHITWNLWLSAILKRYLPNMNFFICLIWKCLLKEKISRGLQNVKRLPCREEWCFNTRTSFKANKERSQL